MQIRKCVPKLTTKNILVANTSYDDERYVERVYLCDQCGDDGCCELRSITSKDLGNYEHPYQCPWSASEDGTVWQRTDQTEPQFYLAVNDTIISSAYLQRDHALNAIKEMCLKNVEVIER